MVRTKTLIRKRVFGASEDALTVVLFRLMYAVCLTISGELHNSNSLRNITTKMYIDVKHGVFPSGQGSLPPVRGLFLLSPGLSQGSV
jgi:hypothetical protein